MRRLLGVSSGLLFAALLPTFLVGCSGEDAPMKTNPALVMNPGGSTSKLPPQAQGLGEQQQKAGEAANQNMNQMAQAMKAAQQKAGAGGH